MLVFMAFVRVLSISLCRRPCRLFGDTRASASWLCFSHYKLHGLLLAFAERERNGDFIALSEFALWTHQHQVFSARC